MYRPRNELNNVFFFSFWRNRFNYAYDSVYVSCGIYVACSRSEHYHDETAIFEFTAVYNPLSPYPPRARLRLRLYRKDPRGQKVTTYSSLSDGTFRGLRLPLSSAPARVHQSSLREICPTHVRDMRALAEWRPTRPWLLPRVVSFSSFSSFLSPSSSPRGSRDARDRSGSKVPIRRGGGTRRKKIIEREGGQGRIFDIAGLVPRPRVGRAGTIRTRHTRRASTRAARAHPQREPGGHLYKTSEILAPLNAS